MLPFIEIGGNYIDSSLFFWGIGIAVMLIVYVTTGEHYGLKRYAALLWGLVLLLAEVVGAKLLYIAENFSSVLETGLTFGGFSFFGIMFSVPLFSLLYSKFARIPYGQFLDFATTGILVELAFYRIGCTFVGCCGGFECSWGIPGDDGLTHFPVQPIEAAADIALGAVLLVLKFKGKLQRGEQYLLYMAGYGAIRFVLEFMRIRVVLFAGLSISHIWAFMACSVGIAVVIVQRVKNKQNTEHVQT